jgi:thiol-disulfide isomerase/thioredoxin
MADKILFFYAEWCNPCTVMKAIIESNSIGLPVEMIDTDINSNKHLVSKYKITGLPTLVYLRNDEYLARSINPHSHEEIISWLAAVQDLHKDKI